jgi:Arc/MetJ-type ribon-helix-helix transcriptional regulator
MLNSYPPKIQSFVDQKIASGEFSSVDDFSIEAAELYVELDRRREALKAKLAVASQEIERGEGIVLEDDAAIATFFLELRSEASGRSTSNIANP